jgi:hypothetical protein
MTRAALWSISLLLLLLVGCRHTMYQTDDLGRKTLEALRSGNAETFSSLLVSRSEYRYLISQMKRSREYHEFTPRQRKDFLRQTLSIAKKYDDGQNRTVQRFRDIHNQEAAKYHIDWSKSVYDTLRLYESSQFMGIPRYDEVQVLFHADSTAYCLTIDGAIQVNKGWKLVANSLDLRPSY